MIKRLALVILVLGEISFFPSNFSWSQSVDPEAANQLQKLSQQSQKLIEEYKIRKENFEAELQQKSKTLTNSPADRLRRRQWMEESNQKLRELQEDFNLEMDSLQEAKSKLIHPESDGSFVRRAPRPRAISDQELKERIRRQDELFRQEDERGNRTPQEILPVDQNAVENNPAVSDEGSSHENPPPVLFPPAPSSDEESSEKSGTNTY